MCRDKKKLTCGLLDMLFPTYQDPGQPVDSSLLDRCWENCSNTQGAKPEGFFYMLSLKDRYFLLKLEAFLGHFLCEDNPGHTAPDLPRPLASLHIHPSLLDQCWENCYNTQGAKPRVFFTYSHWNIGASCWSWELFLAISCVRIILGMLFPTYHGPWPTLGGILVK